MFHSFRRVIRFAFQNFFRNSWLSTVTIFIITLSLISVNFFIIGNVFIDRMVKSIEHTITITINFDPAAPEQDVLAVAARLTEMREVERVDYTSKQTAREKIIAKYEKEGNTVIRDSFDELETNPLFASITIKAKSSEDYQAILTLFEDEAYRDIIQDRKFSDKRDIIKKIKAAKDRLLQIGLAVNIFFASIGILIVFNIIRMTIYARRKEFGIMRLVGATNRFIRAPLLLESALYSFISVFLTILIVFPLLGIIQPYLTFLDGDAFDILAYFSDNFYTLFGAQLAVSLVLNIFGASLAMGRYLKV